MAYGSAPVMTLPPDVAGPSPFPVSPEPATPPPAPAAAPIRVNGPDGQAFDFPADTPEGVIKTALIKHYQSGDGKGWEEKAKAQEAAAADAPASGQPGDASAAVGRGLIEGIPILGAPLMGAVNRGVAGIRALKNDTKYSDELKNVEQFGERTAAEHPYASTAGELAGGALATAPLVAAAPAVFGAGAGGLGIRTAAGLASGAVLGGADAAVRSGGDATAITHGAELGGAFGAAGPLIGRGIGRVAEMATGGEPGHALMREGLKEIPSQVLERAQAFQGSSPLTPTLGEAIKHVSDGTYGDQIIQLERVLANSGGKGAATMGEFYGNRRAQADTLGQRALNDIGERTTSPTDLGYEAQTAARQGVAQTPQGMELQGARDAALPVTPLQAGRAVQGENVANKTALEEARTAAAEPHYSTIDHAPETVGIDGPMVPYEVPGRPVMRTIDNGPAPGPQFDPATAPPTVESLRPVQAAPTIPTEGSSLTRHIAEGGGIGLESGDVKAAGLDRWTQPGIGALMKDTGQAPSIDGHWRPNLIEHGYLPPDAGGGMQRNVHDEVLSLLERERAGEPVYPYWWDGSGEARAARQTLPAAQSEFQHAAERAQGQLHEGLTQAVIEPGSLHPEILDRATGAMIQDQSLHPLDALERVTNALHEPPPRDPATFMEATRERGEAVAPRWGQVDPRPILAGLDQIEQTAKGDVLGFVREAKRFLVQPDGQLDLSARGMLNARHRIDFAQQAAKAVGDNEKAGQITAVRQMFDRQVKHIDGIRAGDAAYQARSVPLEPYTGNGPLAQITRREGNQTSGRLTIAPESVPDMLMSPTALGEALANGGQATRDSLGAHLHTKILAGTEGGGSEAAATIRQRMTQHADALDMMPDVRERVNNVALAHEGMARVEASPLGRVANQPDIKAVTNALFSPELGAGSEHEVGRAMAALTRNNPRVAEQLARYHVENLYNAATAERGGLPGQYGHAGFASMLRGNTQAARNAEAMIRALPNGDARWTGLHRVLDAYEATGWRPRKGSDTAFNVSIQKSLASGKTPIGQAMSDAFAGAGAGFMAGGMKGALAGGAIGIKHGVRDAVTHARMMNNSAAIARLVTDPAAIPDLVALAKSRPGTRNAEVFTARLLARANGALSPLREPATH